MMRLPKFDLRTPTSAAAVVEILGAGGPDAHVVAGGTDLYPNMKRRQHEPKTVVSLRQVAGLDHVTWDEDGTLRLGPKTTLRALERDPLVRQRLPGFWEAVVSISTPLLRNMGTIGGNVCLDTRCYYLNQNYEWRRTINHCLKCGGDTCWTAPGSQTCWAVNSADTVPVLIALGARFELLGPEGEREIGAEEMFAVKDGREWLTKRPDELLTEIVIPAQGTARSVYMKLRRRGTFDFPVLGVAARIDVEGGTVKAANLVLGAVGPAPVVCEEAAAALVGRALDEEAIDEATRLAPKAAKPLDNTDYMPSWRKKMATVYVRRALESFR